MAGFLLDTNIVSELMKPRANRRVVTWVEGTPEELIFLSVITIGEVRKSIDLLPAGDSKRGPLQAWLDRDVRIRFAGRLLAIDEGVAERWGQIEAFAKKRRLTLPTIDALLAATALRHGLTLVTRNVADLDPTGVSLLDPWSS
jgi:toxin FitB